MGRLGSSVLLAGRRGRAWEPRQEGTPGGGGVPVPLRQAGHRPKKAETAQTSEQETLPHLQRTPGAPRNQKSSEITDVNRNHGGQQPKHPG